MTNHEKKDVTGNRSLASDFRVSRGTTSGPGLMHYALPCYDDAREPCSLVLTAHGCATRKRKRGYCDARRSARRHLQKRTHRR